MVDRIISILLAFSIFLFTFFPHSSVDAASTDAASVQKSRAGLSLSEDNQRIKKVGQIGGPVQGVFILNNQWC
jgi:hypothetical protein